MIWAAMAMVAGQGLILLFLLKVIRTFGAYTEALLKANSASLLVHEEQRTVAAALLKVAPHAASQYHPQHDQRKEVV